MLRALQQYGYGLKKYPIRNTKSTSDIAKTKSNTELNALIIGAFFRFKEENKMEQIIAKIDGMMCGMCESHMNDMVRNNFKVKKVTSSHAKKETVIVAEEGFDDAKFTEEVEKLGYKVLGIEHQPYEKKGLFHRK